MKPDSHFQYSRISAANPGRWLLLGICGAGMRAFAEILQDAGQHVTGTDVDTEGLLAFRQNSEFPCGTIPWTDDLAVSSLSPVNIVHSLAVSPMSPLLTAARQQGLTVLPLPEALGSFLKNTRQICVAGTHGKTTTSGMIWWILQQAGLAPAGFVGGEFCQTHRSGSFGAGRLAVIESCEYRQSFLQLRPQSIVLTGIEPDHFDFFPSNAVADQTYLQFIGRLPADGKLLVSSSGKRPVDVAQMAACGLETFGRSPGSDWMAQPLLAQPVFARSLLQPLPDGSVSAITSGFAQAFTVFHHGKRLTDVTLKIPGLHNVDNALAAFAAVAAEGVSTDEISRHLATFPGICRRFEYRGRWRGVDLIDDYAHHPSAIRATLKTARAVFSGRRIVAVFEPHQISRLENLFSEFAEALSAFDECLILPVLPARENATKAQCCRLSRNLVRQISEAGGRAFLVANLDQVPGRLDHAARPGDVVITMGAGRTNQIHDEIHRRLQRDSAA